MALVTTMAGVIGVLVAMALLLWFSTYIESRHLGPVITPDGEAGAPTRLVPDEPVPVEAGPIVIADAATAA